MGRKRLPDGGGRDVGAEEEEEEGGCPGEHDELIDVFFRDDASLLRGLENSIEDFLKTQSETVNPFSKPHLNT